MKRLPIFIACTLLAMVSQAAVAFPGSLQERRHKILPVLVRVGANGAVTDVSPAYELTPQLRRLLRTDLDALIARPAMEHGRPISSQLVVNLALLAEPHAMGGYRARFVYVSKSPVPNGSWYWVHLDGHRLALADRHAFPGRFRRQQNPRWRHTPWIPDSNSPMPGRHVMTSTYTSAAPAGRSERLAPHGH